MDVLDAVLEDWRHCSRGRNGPVLRVDRLAELIDRLSARVAEAEVPLSARRSAYELLHPSRDSGGLAPLVRLLRIDGQFGSPTAEGSTAVVHFAFFWQAAGEIWRRLRDDPAKEPDAEPLALEAAAFRDALLASSAAGSLTPSAFLDAIAASRKASKDELAWVPLEAVARQTLDLKDGQGGGAQPLRVDIVSMMLLVWLQEVVEDYRRGGRAEKIRNVRDVLRCKVGEACEHLGASGWDIEAALRRAFIGSRAPLASLAAGSLGEGWSSCSAKLRSQELSCPICVRDFCRGSEPLVTKCCFQVLCGNCVEALSTPEGLLRCPFCRCSKASPLAPEGVGETAAGEDFFTEVFRVAGTYCAKKADHITKEFMAALQHAEVGPQYDLRVDVVLGQPPSRNLGRAGA